MSPDTPSRFTDTGEGFRQIVAACDTCRHRCEGTLGCPAFDVIPVEIITGKHDHTTPYPGDRGIQFAPLEAPTP